jgi:hypothetical protein
LAINIHKAERLLPMEFLRNLVPAEYPESQERRFQKESQQGFYCQGCSEDIADKTGVIRPVHPELKLHNNAGDNTHGKIDQE